MNQSGWLGQPGTFNTGVLIGPDGKLIGKYRKVCLPRTEIAGASWRDNGAIVLVADWDEAVPLIDRIAHEHLELAIDEAEAIAKGGVHFLAPLGQERAFRLFPVGPDQKVIGFDEADIHAHHFAHLLPEAKVGLAYFGTDLARRRRQLFEAGTLHAG